MPRRGNSIKTLIANLYVSRRRFEQHLRPPAEGTKTPRWTAEEDARLRSTVAEHPGDWDAVARHFTDPDRSATACRLRFEKHLRPPAERTSF